MTICDCPAGDECRATNTVMELHCTAEVVLRGNGTRAGEVLLKQLQHTRQAAYRHAADRLDEALAVKNPDEAVARCWDLVKELRAPDPEAAVGALTRELRGE